MSVSCEDRVRCISLMLVFLLPFMWNEVHVSYRHFYYLFKWIDNVLSKLSEVCI